MEDARCGVIVSVTWDEDPEKFALGEVEARERLDADCAARGITDFEERTHRALHGWRKDGKGMPVAIRMIVREQLKRDS